MGRIFGKSKSLPKQIRRVGFRRLWLTTPLQCSSPTITNSWSSTLAISERAWYLRIQAWLKQLGFIVCAFSQSPSELNLFDSVLRRPFRKFYKIIVIQVSEL